MCVCVQRAVPPPLHQHPRQQPLGGGGEQQQLAGRAGPVRSTGTSKSGGGAVTTASLSPLTQPKKHVSSLPGQDCQQPYVL